MDTTRISFMAMEWEEIPTNHGTSLFFNGFGNQKNGDKAWYVSPMVDLSELDGSQSAI